ncbi:hypothetical protein OS493_033426 [Desmophyllum pertusum]|uniref:Uncharacterized protein n=1 Tax=Desmophyllum pertusum TaxID=174260 RepID=A0A9W9ZXS5_9CNID|nr:hypothetical protein OS493_033426 [Desmophyllum pertusum]
MPHTELKGGLIMTTTDYVNFTTCQLQQIEAALKRSTFTPVCKPDGSFKEIQCTTTPTLQCWRVNTKGNKIEDVDVTIHLPVHRRQPQVSKEKRIGEYPELEGDEIDEIPQKKEKTRCQRMRERRTKKKKLRPTVFVPRCKTNGQFRGTQCQKRTATCWCVDREGKPVSGTRIKRGRPNCRTISVSGDCGRRSRLYSSSDIRRSRRIVGGYESVPNSWPWMVALFFNGTKLGCGGTIIKPSWIATAAHCFSKHTSKNPSDWDVRIGEHSFLKDEGKERKLAVRQILIHPNYKPSNTSHPGNNDIALVRLSSPVQFGRHVNQICLPDSFTYFKAGKRCIVTGWGHMSWNGSSSPVLREAWVDLVGKDACNSQSSYNGTISDNFLCAGFKEGGTDACSYDSGGPLACPVLDGDGRWMLAGIVSWGERCALPHKYGVYTNVNEFTRWMRGAMKMDR